MTRPPNCRQGFVLVLGVTTVFACGSTVTNVGSSATFGFRLDGFKNLVSDFGYSSDATFGLLRAIHDSVTETGGAGYGVTVFLTDIQGRGHSMKQPWLDTMKSRAAERGYAPYARSFSNAYDYVAAH